jgi:hypothetical protein
VFCTTTGPPAYVMKQQMTNRNWWTCGESNPDSLNANQPCCHYHYKPEIGGHYRGPYVRLVTEGQVLPGPFYRSNQNLLVVRLYPSQIYGPVGSDVIILGRVCLSGDSHPFNASHSLCISRPTQTPTGGTLPADHQHLSGAQSAITLVQRSPHLLSHKFSVSNPH